MMDDVSFRGDPDPFDCWLKNELRARFNDVVREPIPESLLRIIGATEASGHVHALRPSRAEEEAVSECSADTSSR
ncbi:hypothetical protein [Komagataeibacter oboediens]|uniref:hypothetical protein n=1 Tax=Komagataeibacter oboediens TaxID=65958 RepID=UPI0012F485B8|nr:hypothetical protein [Komagataeibacter oboediens]